MRLVHLITSANTFATALLKKVNELNGTNEAED